ncbi:two-component system response regulator CreB [Iodobacter fluviatilis]|uniref:Transcriptional regulatory protein CreB n=1 Tax=Iodobacter fluviatilis TaxID=537 RepID=A0A377SWL5_9NEIS|nr:two-component system response regulator CreB [Iodobacter fluviatilis]TCU82962.1 two-component system catabolic regulation response regulator CreB [Iodobacter fluviatilis]STR45785.1 Transcriptional regulatory protein CreB [Iodobacter fluviatilis]
MSSIILIEDEAAISDTLRFALEREGFSVSCYSLAREGEAAIQAQKPDLLILDIGLPDDSGLEVLKRLRRYSELPVLLLTARSEEFDRILGLELGADDYVLKPFSPREVAARVKAILKRSNPAAIISHSAIHNGLFVHDAAAKRVQYAGNNLTLTPSEYRLLITLLAHPGQVFSRAQLLDALGEAAEDSFERTIDSHIKSLRAKLRVVRPNLDPIATHRGFGYALEQV